MKASAATPAQIDPTAPRRLRHRQHWWQRPRVRQLVLLGAIPVLALGALLLYLVQEQRAREQFLQFHQQRPTPPSAPRPSPPLTANPLEDPLLVQARQLARRGQPTTAAELFRQLLARQPESIPGRLGLALVLVELGDSAQAIAEYHRVLAADPVHVVALNNLADLLSSHPEASLRNGPQSLELAQRAAVAAPSNPAVLATLASAQAENGQFQQAVRTAQQAIDLAHLRGQPGLAELITNQLRWYEQGLPYREPRFLPRPSSPAEPVIPPVLPAG